MLPTNPRACVFAVLDNCCEILLFDIIQERNILLSRHFPAVVIAESFALYGMKNGQPSLRYWLLDIVDISHVYN